MNLTDIEKLTIELGESWGISHMRRVLGLIDVIGEGPAYRREVLQFAVYLHDWGASPQYRRV